MPIRNDWGKAMFLSRILILPAVIAALAFTASGASKTTWANDDQSRDGGLDYLADHLLETIEKAHHNAALLDHAFFESMDAFDRDDYVHLAFYRALPGIDWYRNHDARHWVRENQRHYYHDFMDANRVTVAVVVDSADGYVASMVAEGVMARLPAHAVYSSDPGYSDIVISVRLGEMEPQYRERSRKPKSKKYKKKYRSKPPVDQQIHFASYTKVKESVIVALSYEIEISAGAGRVSARRSSMTLRDNFSYGVDYQAYGAAGPVQGVPFPSGKVRKLVTRDPEAVRAQIAGRLVDQAAARVATMLDYDTIPLQGELRNHGWRLGHR